MPTRPQHAWWAHPQREGRADILDARTRARRSGTCGQNPTGINYKKARLQALYAVAQKHDCTFLEDDPYMYLNCADGKPSGLYGLACADAGPADRCSLLSIDTDARVVRVDTFSKFVAPGMRCSWVTLPEQYIDDASVQEWHAPQFVCGRAL